MNIRMSTKGKRPLRSLTPSDKIHAIQRIHDGESKASVARDIGVPESTLRGWCKNEDKLRFMSRQSASDKMAADSLSEKLDGSSVLLGGPPEKRQKLDSSLPLNFSNKIKFDEMNFKRSPINGLDYSTNKALTDLSFGSLTPDYVAFNGAVKNKVFGADISRQTDPSIAAISPLSSLSHLSGLTGITQSPLAISFNELTSNLNLLAQLNPGLAAMSGLNSLAATANTLRNVKTRPQPQSPHSENSDRQQGIAVKNWAKQKPNTGSSESNYGLNLSQTDKNKIKCPSPSLAPSIGANLPPLPTIPDDPLLYWLKSQQAMLGLNNIYPPHQIGATSPPIRSSTPQLPSTHANTPPTSTPLTPSSTPSGSLDDKNAAWFNWCKAFGASLNSLAPATAVALQTNPLQQSQSSSGNPTSLTNQKPPFENILYSQLTKDTSSPSLQSTSSVDNMHNNEVTSNADSTSKPEDLSAKSAKTISPAPSLPTPDQSPTQTHTPTPSPTHSPVRRSEADTVTSANEGSAGSVADCKDVLDNLLYKINSNPSSAIPKVDTPGSMEVSNDSDLSYNSEGQTNNNDISANNNNNNNNSNKTDEEERIKFGDISDEDDDEAIKHGEKFLKWLENCSNPRVTSVQLMQLRFLIAAVKSNADPKAIKECNNLASTSLSETEDSVEETCRNKVRRRK
ncbi:protein distal antenna-like [Teleopsis dalmanni]|uniref:protein distal antenna-like n=1 Tax=Teleopsis dalmanni TaxID=139649 RepID=UPI0018CE4245|nr:protein distal antenna-like [Teleopsis dalmanni]